MTTLGSLIVERKVATIAEVDEALARQVVDGGDLVTGLLEVSAASEEALTALLAETLHLEVAAVGELPRAAAALLRLVPLMVVERHGIYPLDEHHGVLRLATAEPLPQQMEDDLGFALGVHLRACAAPLVRIRQALARDYGVKLEKRFVRLLAKLEGRPVLAASEAPLARLRTPAFASDVVNHPTTPPLVAKPRAAARSRTWPGLPWPSPPAPLEAFASIPAGPSTTPAPRTVPPGRPLPPLRPGAPQPRSTTPLPQALLASAARATASQLDRQRRQREPAPNQVLLGWARRALGNSIPADRPEDARRGPLTAADAERRLVATSTAEEALGVFFAFAKQYFDYAALFLVHGDLAEGHEAAGAGARRDQVRGVGVALDLPSILASARSRAAPTLGRLSRSGLDVDLRNDLGRSAEGEVLVLPVMVRRRCVALLYGDHDDAPVELSEIGDVIAIERLTGAALERIVVRRKRASSGHGSSHPPARSDAPPARSDAPSAEHTTATNDDAPPAHEPWRRRDLEPNEPSAPEGTHSYVRPFEHAQSMRTRSTPAPSGVPGRSSAMSDTAGPEVLVVEGEDVSLQELIERIEQYPPVSLDRGGDPLGSASISAEAQLPPQSRRPYQDLPPVLIRPELVDQVVSGGERGERALGEILALGEAAIPSVFARFPGPLTVDRRQPIGQLPRPADCGPVLRIVAAMRRLALPFLAVRSADTDVEIRFWATYLLGELNYADSGQALFPRLFDESVAVRKIAVRAARNLLAAGEGGAPLRRSLERLITYADEPEARRIAAVRALAELRIYRSVPALIAALTDPSFAVAESAARALAIVTRLELGHDAKKWHEWWEAKGQKRLT